MTSTSILPQPLSLNNYPSNIYASKLIEFVFGLDDKASSLFAPSAPHPKHAGSVRAVHLGAANKCLGRTAYHNHELFVPSYSASPYGMRTDVLLLDAEFFPFHGPVKVRTTAGHWFLAILACQHAQRDEGLLPRVCYVGPSTFETQPLVGGLVSRRIPPTPPRPGSGRNRQLDPIFGGFPTAALPGEPFASAYVLHSVLRARSPGSSASTVPSTSLDHAVHLPEWQKAVL